jgi:outer membrane protein assembly factor BamB
VAFDKRTGKELWRALSATQPGYCPPIIHQVAGSRQLLIWHGNGVEGLNPVTGEVYWSVDVKPTYGMSIGHPVVDGNRIYMMSFNRVSACIEVARGGRSAELLWRGNTARGIGGVMNTAFLEDGHIYACGQNGRYICARLADGERLWTSFAPSTGSRPASWANVFTVKHRDRFFLVNDLGDVIIARLTPEGYDEVSRARLIDPTHRVAGRLLVWSHPAFANRCIYLRNDREIICYSLATQDE